MSKVADNSKCEADDKTAAGQIAAMRSLRQKSAAWLLGWKSSRPLRDRTAPPQNSDGTYDGQELVAWSRSQLPSQLPALSADDAERAQILADMFVPGFERDVHTVVQFADDIQRRYGAGGLAAVMQVLVDECRAIARITGPPQPPEREAEIRERHAQQLAEALAWNSRTLFGHSVVCDGCSKLRRGAEWVDAQPHDGHVVRRDLCPKCLSKPTR
jgi:hypothetical protein